MNAARYIGNGALEVVDTEAPHPSPGEVQLEVAYTGICGTDLHILHGAMDVRVTMPAANFWLYIYNALRDRDAKRAAAADLIHLSEGEQWLRQLMQAEDALAVLATEPPDTNPSGNGDENTGSTP